MCPCSSANDKHLLSTPGKSTADLKFYLKIKQTAVAWLPFSKQVDYNLTHIFSQCLFKGLLLFIQAGPSKSMGDASPARLPQGSSWETIMREGFGIHLV